MNNKKVLITAGSTYERIDAVRAIMSNFSSGKMGLELADSFLNLGYEVHCIVGRVDVQFTDIEHSSAYTAMEMLQAVQSKIHQYDMYVSTAAIADYKPIKQHSGKISGTNIMIEFTKNTDIMQYVYDNYPSIVVAGFTIDDTDDASHAIKKLRKADCIIRNKHTAICSNDNTVDIITKNDFIHISTTTKTMIAKKVSQFLHEYQK